MDQTHTLETCWPPHLITLFEAATFSELLHSCGEATAAILGADAAGEVSLLLPVNEALTSGWVINATTLQKRRWSRLYQLNGPLIEAASQAAGCYLHPGSPNDLLSPESGHGATVSDMLGGAMLVPFGEDRGNPGLLAVALNRLGAGLDPACRDGLRQMGQALDHVIPRILQHELTESQNRQIISLHESMTKIMVAADRPSLLSGLLSILNRQFGFSRALIAQVQPETQTLRSELHSGFSAHFVPLTISLDNDRDLFIQALNHGSPIVLGGERDQLPAGLPPTLIEGEAERRVILPLRLGLRPVGLIYAEQTAHDGAPLFDSVLEIFARLTAAALENLTLRQRAEQRAETDALTGLYNRHFLDRVLEIEIPRVKRYNHPISLLMIDLCGFKHINDTYGHPFGDFMLRETANLLQANVRKPDVVVRYGGDEFLVLMVNTSLEQARMVRNRIEQAFIERNQMQHDERMMIKISLGLRSADASTIEGLLSEADAEMYAHKARQTRDKLIEALIAGHLEQIEQADRVVGSLCNILYKKAPYYADHARRVTHMALKLARRLGWAAGEIETLALAALLHDVGKVSIPTEILRKIEPLSAAEMEAMRHHPALGEEFFQGLEHLEPLRPIIRSHHERYDGQTTGEYPGYPDGLCGERIPLAARILRLAESADAMLSGRSYRPAKPPEAVTRILREEAGTTYDPHLVNLLLADKNWHEALGDPAAITALLVSEA